MRLLSAAVRVLLAAVFVYAGATKMGDPAAFAQDVMAYRLLPGAVSHVLAYYLPWLEIVAGLALLAPRWSRAGATVLATLMAGFTVTLASAWWRGLDITCGCFGGAGKADYGWLIAHDLLLLAGLAFGFATSTAIVPGQATGPTAAPRTLSDRSGNFDPSRYGSSG